MRTRWLCLMLSALLGPCSETEPFEEALAPMTYHNEIDPILAHLGSPIRAPPQDQRRRLCREGRRLNTWRVGKNLCEIFLYQMDEDLSRAR